MRGDGRILALFIFLSGVPWLCCGWGRGAWGDGLVLRRGYTSVYAGKKEKCLVGEYFCEIFVYQMMVKAFRSTKRDKLKTWFA